MTSYYYKNTLQGFLRDVKNDRFLLVMKKAARRHGNSDSEVKSWEANANALVRLFNLAKLPDDVVITFEFQVGGGRIDCALFGQGENESFNAIIIELKQWSNNNVSLTYGGNSFYAQVEVEGFKSPRECSHPSEQILSYKNYLEHFMPVFGGKDKSVNLYPIAYCFNYVAGSDEVLFNEENYNIFLKDAPLFGKGNEDELCEKLSNLLALGRGELVWQRIERGSITPTESLLDVVANLFNDEKTTDYFKFNLLGHQLDAYNEIKNAIDFGEEGRKVVIIVKGGPGTGKSVIAMQLVAALAREKKFAYYVTRSSSLINGFKEKLDNVEINKGTLQNASDIIKYIYKFKPSVCDESSIDAIIIDEAHRISAPNHYSAGMDGSKTFLSQTLSLIFCARVVVFMIDDMQFISDREIGYSDKIKDIAENYDKGLEVAVDRALNDPNYNYGIQWCRKEIKNREQSILKGLSDAKRIEKQQEIERLKEYLYNSVDVQINRLKNRKIRNIDIFEITLPDQFRCNGSDNFLDWVEDVLYNNGRKGVVFDSKDYDFKIYDSPHELYDAIRSSDDFARIVDAIPEEKRNLYKNYKEMVDKYIIKELGFNSNNAQTARLGTSWLWEWENKNQLKPYDKIFDVDEMRFVEKEDADHKDGDLRHSVALQGKKIGIFALPWESKVASRNWFRGMYAKSAESWANEPQGVNQVGCIYSMQGWEQDYIGIIIGPDLRYSKERGLYVDDVYNYGLKVTEFKSQSQRRRYEECVRNIYRVLMTRGKKGCFVYACDPAVSQYLKECLKGEHKDS